MLKRQIHFCREFSENQYKVKKMKQKQRKISLGVILIFGWFLMAIFFARPDFQNEVNARVAKMTMVDEFNQDAVLAKLREQIKGKEKEPAEKVFKNIQILKGIPAGRVLAVMEFGFSRSLGVNCTHCHTPEDWSKEDKTKKQVAREMWAMQQSINNQLLKNIKNIGEKATVNCTTCHRGQIIPALNLPMPSQKQ